MTSIVVVAQRGVARVRRMLDGEPKQLLLTTFAYFTLFVLVMAIGGFLVAASGIIPIKASSGHWAITQWFLQFSKQRSVTTHTLGMETPSLDAARLVLTGAGAYENNCRACHGSPSLQNPRVAQAMLPRPPYLPHTISRWDSNELFYIVKHGLKFTGMPAWPSQQRDDEVWAMVAFLRKFPELDAAGYDSLVNGEVPASIQVLPDMMPRAIVESCARCHGKEGFGRGVGAFPKIARQNFEYLYSSLQAYQRGERHSGVMGPVAAALNDLEIQEISRYYADLTIPSPFPLPQQSPAVERGELIARQGIPSQRVPPCAECHGPAESRRNPVYPKIAGQYAEYLKLQLELFKKGARGGTAYSHLMTRVAAGLTPEQMNDASLYYASLHDDGLPQ
jgi:cytochrome c553/cytochrome c5